MPDLDSSALRDVPWSWRDVLLGLAVVIAVAVALYLILDLLQLTHGVLGRPWLALSLSGLIQGSMLAYPLWVARRRGFSPGMPGFRTVPVESFLALLAVGVVMSIAIVLVAVVILL